MAAAWPQEDEDVGGEGPKEASVGMTRTFSFLHRRDAMFEQQMAMLREDQLLDQMQMYREELSDWISDLLDIDPPIRPKKFMEEICNGVYLLRLAQLIERRKAEWRYETDQPEDKAAHVIQDRHIHRNAKQGDFFSRDNVAQFIEWMKKHLGVVSTVLFTTEDLTHFHNEKQVLNCLMEITHCLPGNMKPPPSVQLLQDLQRGIVPDQNIDDYVNKVVTETSGFTPYKTKENLWIVEPNSTEAHPVVQIQNKLYVLVSHHGFIPLESVILTEPTTPPVDPPVKLTLQLPLEAHRAKLETEPEMFVPVTVFRAPPPERAIFVNPQPVEVAVGVAHPPKPALLDTEEEPKEHGYRLEERPHDHVHHVAEVPPVVEFRTERAPAVQVLTGDDDQPHHAVVTVTEHPHQHQPSYVLPLVRIVTEPPVLGAQAQIEHEKPGVFERQVAPQPEKARLEAGIEKVEPGQKPRIVPVQVEQTRSGAGQQKDFPSVGVSTFKAQGLTPIAVERERIPVHNHEDRPQQVPQNASYVWPQVKTVNVDPPISDRGSVKQELPDRVKFMWVPPPPSHAEKQAGIVETQVFPSVAANASRAMFGQEPQHQATQSVAGKPLKAALIAPSIIVKSPGQTAIGQGQEKRFLAVRANVPTASVHTPDFGWTMQPHQPPLQAERKAIVGREVELSARPLWVPPAEHGRWELGRAQVHIANSQPDRARVQSEPQFFATPSMQSSIGHASPFFPAFQALVIIAPLPRPIESGTEPRVVSTRTHVASPEQRFVQFVWPAVVPVEVQPPVSKRGVRGTEEPIHVRYYVANPPEQGKNHIPTTQVSWVRPPLEPTARFQAEQQFQANLSALLVVGPPPTRAFPLIQFEVNRGPRRVAIDSHYEKLEPRVFLDTNPVLRHAQIQWPLTQVDRLPMEEPAKVSKFQTLSQIVGRFVAPRPERAQTIHHPTQFYAQPLQQPTTSVTKQEPVEWSHTDRAPLAERRAFLSIPFLKTTEPATHSVSLDREPRQLSKREAAPQPRRQVAVYQPPAVLYEQTETPAGVRLRSFIEPGHVAQQSVCTSFPERGARTLPYETVPAMDVHRPRLFRELPAPSSSQRLAPTAMRAAHAPGLVSTTWQWPPSPRASRFWPDPEFYSVPAARPVAEHSVLHPAADPPLVNPQYQPGSEGNRVSRDREPVHFGCTVGRAPMREHAMPCPPRVQCVWSMEPSGRRTTVYSGPRSWFSQATRVLSVPETAHYVNGSVPSSIISPSQPDEGDQGQKLAHAAGSSTGVPGTIVPVAETAVVDVGGGITATVHYEHLFRQRHHRVDVINTADHRQNFQNTYHGAVAAEMPMAQGVSYGHASHMASCAGGCHCAGSSCYSGGGSCHTCSCSSSCSCSRSCSCSCSSSCSCSASHVTVSAPAAKHKKRHHHRHHRHKHHHSGGKRRGHRSGGSSEVHETKEVYVWRQDDNGAGWRLQTSSTS